MPARAPNPESRWWYWVAGVPAVAVFWVVTAGWLAVVVSAEFGGGVGGVRGTPLAVAVDLSALVVALPFAVVLAVAPVATYYDASALRAVGVPVDVRRWALLAAVGPACAVGGYLLAGPGTFVLGGAVGGVPVAVAYLRVRHRAVGVPWVPGRRR